ncbi:MAG: GFA family protein [Gammaproteobacteria bacterium]
MTQGGCFCGALRYELDTTGGWIVNCHCEMCRRTSGAAYVTWIIVARGQFRMVKGEPGVLHSSDHGRRGFCMQCGTPITFTTTKRPENIDVTVCSLDDPAPYAPTEDVYVEGRLEWVHALGSPPA